jgi:hypothetical protein
MVEIVVLSRLGVVFHRFCRQATMTIVPIPFIIGSTQRRSAIGAFENIKSYISNSLKILNQSNKQINISSLYDTNFVQIFLMYDLNKKKNVELKI